MKYAQVMSSYIVAVIVKYPVLVLLELKNYFSHIWFSKMLNWCIFLFSHDKPKETHLQISVDYIVFM